MVKPALSVTSGAGALKSRGMLYRGAIQTHDWIGLNTWTKLTL